MTTVFWNRLWYCASNTSPPSLFVRGMVWRAMLPCRIASLVCCYLGGNRGLWSQHFYLLFIFTHSIWLNVIFLSKRRSFEGLTITSILHSGGKSTFCAVTRQTIPTCRLLTVQPVCCRSTERFMDWNFSTLFAQSITVQWSQDPK